ncbi:MAG: tetratricopeptide repeat protein [Gammaproteobacteria bacterium]
MSSDHPVPKFFRLGDFVVDATAGTLTLNGDVTSLQPKVMQLLICLTEHHGQIVSKEYLLEHVWKGTFVVDGALRRCIYLLRKVLSKSDGEKAVLETLPRRGYRLLCAPTPLNPDQQELVTQTAEYDGDAYRGLQVFDQSHADIFFGRRAAVQQVVDAMDAQVANGHGFCLILGPSGSGKSSLARAGVVPALLSRSAQDDQDQLLVATFSMNESPTDPLGHFATRLTETILGEQASAQRATALAQQLENDDEAAVSSVLEMLAAADDTPSKRLLLVFDQFEELLVHDGGEAFRSQFLAVLYPLVRSGAVWMLATMRSEFYPQFAEIEALRFLRGEHGQVDLAFPGAAEIADIVRKPAALAGLSFGMDENSRRLDQIIIDAATRQDNSLPLLQFALSELELKSQDNVLQVEDYYALGELAGCLSGHADRIFDALPASTRAALPFMLERMVIADPRNVGRVLKRTVSLTDFDAEPGATPLVNAFIEARLVTTFLDRTTGVPSAQFAHEAVLANWDRGRDWVQSNYAEIRFRSWLNELAARWDDDDRSRHYLMSDGKPLVEARRLAAGQPSLSDTALAFVKASHRRSSIRDIVRGAITLTLAALTVTASLMWRSAVTSREQAQSATLRAEATSDFLLSIFENADPGATGRSDLTAVDLLNRARDSLSGKFERVEVVDRAAMLSKLGETYLLVGHYGIADKLFTQAETMLPEIEDQYPAVASKVLLELGALRNEQQDYAQSGPYLARALGLAKAADRPALIAHTLNIQGLQARSQGSPQAAADLFLQAERALDSADVLSPAVTKLRPSLYDNLGSVYYQMNELELADEAISESLSLRVEYGRGETADQTNGLSGLGLLRSRQGRNEEAVELFEQAIDGRIRLHGDRHPYLATYLINKSSAEMKLERFIDARESARRGLEVLSHNNAQPEAMSAVFRRNLMIASWLGGLRVTAADMDNATNEIPLLAAAYGEDHALVHSTRIAIIGLRIDAASVDDVDALCGQLSAAVQQMPPAEPSALTSKLDTYFDQNGVCTER